MFAAYGLGNPGREYSRDRHNAGRMLVQQLASRSHISFDISRRYTHAGKGRLHGKQVLLAVPNTLMNRSGRGFRELMDHYDLAPSDILIAFDDLDLSVGHIRLRPSGGSGGHKGVQSILESAGTDQIPRLRIGIGRPEGQKRVSDYVLSPFEKGEKEKIEKALSAGCQAINHLLNHDFQTTMNRFNGPAEDVRETNSTDGNNENTGN